MKKRIVSMILSATLILSNLSGLEINAANNNTEESVAEENTVTLDAPEEEDVLYIPEGTVRIEDNEFDGYGTRWNAAEGDHATKIVLPSTLEYIGNKAFASSCIEEIVIPGNVKEIGNDAFWNCKNLKKVTIEDGVEKLGRALFRDCDNLETVIFPKSVKEWNTECAFYNCNIKNITLPEEGMTTLGSGMFGGCPLEEIVIPDCVTTMNYGVFISCENLKLVKAGYNVVNFEQGEEYYDLYNYTKGCFGIGCSGMVLEAPLDSAIVEYARNYRYFTVKYDYPDFERIEFSSTGVMEYDYKSSVDEQYEVTINKTVYPDNQSINNGSYNVLETNILREDGKSFVTGYGMKVEIDGRSTYSLPVISIFSYETHSQDENLEYTVKHTYYFRLTLTDQSFEDKRVQIEILTSGTWDSEDAQWELITPAIDTAVLTPVPTQAPQITQTVTTGPAMEPTKVPEPTKVFQQDKEITPVVTEKIAPTPTVKAEKPAKVSLKSAKQLTVKKQGKKKYKKEVKLSWKKTKNADGYVVYMKAGKGKYKAVKTITNEKTVNYTKKNLKKGKTYYFKVRAYRKMNGQKVYGNYSGVKKVKVK